MPKELKAKEKTKSSQYEREIPRGTNPSQRWVFEGGSLEHEDDALEVRTGVTARWLEKPVADPVKACDYPSKKSVPDVSDGITIKVKCKENPHVVQFNYREKFDKDGKVIAGPINTSSGIYQTTTDPEKPNWNTDSEKPNPSYASAGSHRKDDGALTVFDLPSLTHPRDGASRVTFKTYVYCNGEVIREISWVRERKQGSAPTYTVIVSEKKPVVLPDWATKQLQADGYDLNPS